MHLPHTLDPTLDPPVPISNVPIQLLIKDIVICLIPNFCTHIWSIDILIDWNEDEISRIPLVHFAVPDHDFETL